MPAARSCETGNEKGGAPWRAPPIAAAFSRTLLLRLVRAALAARRRAGRAHRREGAERGSLGAGEAGFLRQLQAHDALAVIGDRLHLVDLGQREVALGLGHEEVRGHAGRELLLLGVEPLLLQHARRLRGVDALEV